MLEAGQLIAGRYRLQSAIGEGAMASVWQAQDETLKRPIAIKFLFVQGTRDPQAMVDQFLREARLAASVQHRNVIQTVDFGTLDNHQPFMVMELLEGESLAERMERDPPLSPEQFVHVMSLTLRGLAAVHDAGIVHRDLKPANIFLQRDADAIYPKILDFGISRSLQEGSSVRSAIATQQGMIVGTPDFMSPEQARGEADIDKRADIYAMGAMLYLGLTGRLPFEAETIGDLIVEIVTSKPRPIEELYPDIQPALAAVVKQAMAKQRAERFADARALRRALMTAMEKGRPTGQRVISIPPPEPAAAKPVAKAPPPPPSAATRVARPSAAQPAPGETAGWGDFEGLHAGGARDGGAARAATPATPTARREPEAAAARAAPAGPPPASGSSGKDLLDPLYGGTDEPAPDLDYGAISPETALRASAAGRTTATSATRVSRPRGKSKGKAARPSTPRAKPSARPQILLLAIAVVLLGAYVALRPDGAPENATQVRGTTAGRALVNERRKQLKTLPPHLRDVHFDPPETAR